MGGFNVAPNPAPDPGGFANAATGAYNDGLRFAQALRTAAAQQQQHNQQSLKDQFETELKLRKDGYTPYMQQGETKPSGLKTRDPQPNVDPNQVIQDHFGRKWVAPPAKPGATPQQTYTDTKGALDSGGQTVFPRLKMDEAGKTTDTGTFGPNVPDQSRVVQPPGSSQHFYMPTGDEKAASKLQQDLTAAAAKPGAPHIDTEHFSSPVLIDPKTGKATAIQLPAGVEHNDRPDKYTYSHFTNDAGKVTHTRTGETGAQQWNGKEWAPMEAGAAIGPKRKDPDAPKSATPTQLNAIESKKRAGLVRAEVAFKKAMKDATATGDDAAVKEAQDTLTKAKQDTQDAYQQSLQQFGLPTEDMQYDPVTPGPGAPPTQKPTQAAPAGQKPAPQKFAGVDKIRAYATAKGISVGAAVKEFQDSGYTIGQ